MGEVKRTFNSSNIASLLVVLLVIIFVLSCSFYNPINSEASKVATDYWNSLFTICGDDYYSASKLKPTKTTTMNHLYKLYKLGYRLYQYRGVEYKIIDEDLSEADVMNGFEYKGTTIVTCNVYRQYRKSWSNWNNCARLGEFEFFKNSIHFYKKDGTWSYNKIERDAYTHRKISTAMLIKTAKKAIELDCSNITKHVIDQIKASGRVIRGWLGIYIHKVTPEIADVFGAKEGQGVLVADVMAESPANTGGLERGDIILEYNGEKIKEVSDLTGKVALTPPGEVAKLKIIRDKKTQEISIKIGEFPEDDKVAKKKEKPKEKFGLVVVDITPKIAGRLNLDSTDGVIVNSVSRGYAASEAGFKRGDVILEINGIIIKNVDEYNKRLEERGKGNSALFLIKRRETTVYVGLKIE